MNSGKTVTMNSGNKVVVWFWLKSAKYLQISQNDFKFDSKRPTGAVEGFEINADFKVPFRN